MTTCTKCHATAITYIRYNGTHLCKNHFSEYLERRVKKDLKKQMKTTPAETIGIALSGGKDSTTALHLTHQIYAERRDVTLHAITVDEGIQGYRDHSLPIARKACDSLDIEHHIVSFKDLIGHTMDEIATHKDEIGECSYCGVFRRRCLNHQGRQLGLTRLITGHNLDDMAQSILMNFANADMEKLARLGPHSKIQPGFIPRSLPLRTIPEQEIMLYAILHGYEFHNAECPYAVRAARGTFRDVIAKLEDASPGTRHSLLKSYDSIKDLLQEKYPPSTLNHCQGCHEPTSQQYCKTCLLQQRLASLKNP
jgi:uncharacterized protein (TIGR00269 family)